MCKTRTGQIEQHFRNEFGRASHLFLVNNQRKIVPNLLLIYRSKRLEVLGMTGNWSSRLKLQCRLKVQVLKVQVLNEGAEGRAWSRGIFG